MKRGVKRITIFMVLFATQWGYAEPVSLLQETLIVPPAPIPISVKEAFVQRGTASWYSETDPLINKHTANGEVFDDSKLTCASWNFPFNTRLIVTNAVNGKSVVCRVNDRGPAKRLNRVIDLTKGAFRQIGDLEKGLIEVAVQPQN